MRNCASEVWSCGPSRNDGFPNWRGVRRVTPNPSFSLGKTRFLCANRKTTSLENAIKYQPACKPGSVRHRPLARTVRDGHSSGTMFAHGLEQPTRTASLTSPRGVIACANIPLCRPYSVLLPVWFAMPFPLPDPRCALTAPFHPYFPLPSLPRKRGRVGWGKRFILCGTVPGVAPAGCYPAPYVDGARTFLSRSLSTVAGAAVRPTDVQGMGARAACVKRSRWLIRTRARNFDIRERAAFDIGFVDVRIGPPWTPNWPGRS
jgi:hypothetical protein